MNKFIRTKEGIYELKKGREIVEGWDIAGNPHLVEYEYDQYSGESDEYNLGVYISQADTIEELCDEFVIHNFSYYKKPYIPTSQINIKAIPIETFIKCDMQLYGAIWTDKGLIYVAKMNEKGDLELI